MSHTLLKIGDGYKCSVCTQTWRGKPRSVCPGVIVYEWGKQPEHLVLQRDLFAKGLKLAEGQQHVGVAGSNSYRLYDINEAVPHGLKIDFGNSKYAFLDVEDGFDIYRVCGTQICVRYADTYIKVWQGGYSNFRQGSGLYDFKGIVQRIAELFVAAIMPSAKKSEAEEAAEMIARALTSRFKTHWRRIITDIVPKDVELVARKMWSSALSDAEVLHYPELYQEEHAFLYRDLIQFHAARLAMLKVHVFASFNHRELEMQGKTNAHHTAVLKDLCDWRKWFAPTVPNKALNKTLDKLPVGISPRQIVRMSVMHLEKPITTRLHISFALSGSEHYHWGLHERIVLSASDELIKAAAEAIGRRLTAKSKLRDISDTVNLILDYPQAFTGDLLGLARRSAAWHEETHTKIERGLSDNHLLPVPNIDLDHLKEQGITLLATAGDVYEEGKRMHHCVGSYASKAAEGHCYLFHVEYNGERATIEISPRGYALQGYGPTNAKNAACEYGAKQLEAAFKVKVSHATL